jgi:hypothetical protein
LIAGSQGEIDVIKFALKGEYVRLQGLGGTQFGAAPLAHPGEVTRVRASSILWE